MNNKLRRRTKDETFDVTNDEMDVKTRAASNRGTYHSIFNATYDPTTRVTYNTTYWVTIEATRLITTEIR